MQGVRAALAPGLGPVDVIGTYDHLRTPFANRLCAGDLRFNKFLEHEGRPQGRGVLLLLDVLQPPEARPYGSLRGLASGLGIFSPTFTQLDSLGSPKKYLHRQPRLRSSVLSESLVARRVAGAAFSWMRNQGVPRSQAKRSSTVLERRAQEIAAIYRDVDGMESRRAIQEVRRCLWKRIGLDDPRFRTVLLSDILGTLAVALDTAASEGFDLTKVPRETLGDGSLFVVLHPDGTRDGFVVPTNRSLRIVGTQGRAERAIRFSDLLRQLERGLAVPTTVLLFAVLHRLAQYPAFGDSHDLDQRVRAWPGIAGHTTTVTREATSTPNLGLVRVGDKKYRHVTVDLLVHAPEDLLVHARRTAESGKPSYDLDLLSWATEQNHRPGS